MSTTWAEVNSKLDSFLGDAEKLGADGTPRPRLFPIPLRVYAWNWAQRLLCKHTPLQKQAPLAIRQDERSAILPSDLYQVDRIFDAQAEKFMHPLRFEHGHYRYPNEDEPGFWLWGDRLFLQKSAADTALTLYYWAYYPEVELVTEEAAQGQIATPGWAELPLIHLATAACMNPLEIEASDLNQYKTRFEAGTPLHNPRAESVKFHIEMWYMMLSWYPPAIGG